MLALLLLLACGGPKLDGQHDACTTSDDCADTSLECVASEAGDLSCERPCTTDEDCADAHQTCEMIGSWGEGGICYEGPA